METGGGGSSEMGKVIEGKKSRTSTDVSLSLVDKEESNNNLSL